jgi:7-cyano-7-deazaguanine synthase
MAPVERPAPATIVLFSGGIDSSTLAAHYVGNGILPEGLFIDYGQPSAAREWTAAQQMAASLRITIHKADVANLQVAHRGEVVGRNAFFLLTALMFLRPSEGVVAIGVHDGSGYADCTRSFVETIQLVFDIYCRGLVQVAAPFVSWGKADVYDYAQALQVPLPLTYSCELGLEQPCGECPSCSDLERLSART